MWCRDGHGGCGDEVPHGATAEMTESRRRGPYIIFGELQDGELGMARPDRLDPDSLTDHLSDGRYSHRHRPIDTSGVSDMQFVGFPLRWRMDLRALFSRPEDVAGSLDYFEVRGCWALGTINTASAGEARATGKITVTECPIATFSRQGGPWRQGAILPTPAARWCRAA